MRDADITEDKNKTNWQCQHFYLLYILPYKTIWSALKKQFQSDKVNAKNYFKQHVKNFQSDMRHESISKATKHILKATYKKKHLKLQEQKSIFRMTSAKTDFFKQRALKKDIQSDRRQKYFQSDAPQN